MDGREEMIVRDRKGSLKMSTQSHVLQITFRDHIQVLLLKEPWQCEATLNDTRKH